MKKLIALLLVLAMLVFVAVSCGKEATTGEKGDTTQAPATETAEKTPETGGMVIDDEGAPVTMQW